MLRHQIREVLLERILLGDYEPGMRIVEAQVAQEFDVSPGPVREALRELEALGMIVSTPYRGARVREVTARELAEIYPLRAAIEEVAARDAAVRLDGDVAALEAEVAAMRAAADAGDTHELLVHDVSFHWLIVQASGNITLRNVWRSLRVEARTMITIVKSGADPHFIAESHVPVLEALRERDAQQAGQRLRAHVEEFAAWVSTTADGDDGD
jgi:DNA-binding GntR family transcriptional regulator